MKHLIWMGSSRREFDAFPEAVRNTAGYELYRVQSGYDPDDWKPMSTVGDGVKEVRISKGSGAFRVLYLAKRPEGVYVLHCFQKKSRKTARADVELARQRFKAIPRIVWSQS